MSAGVSSSLYSFIFQTRFVGAAANIIMKTFIISAGLVGGRPAVSSPQLLYPPLTLVQCVCVCVCGVCR